jgi:hypothetical protein
VFEALGEHPTTINDVVIDATTGEEKPRDFVLTSRGDVGKRQRLDYIFYGTRRNDAEPSRFEMQIRSAQVQPFFVQHALFTQLSDHYSVIASLRITKR